MARSTKGHHMTDHDRIKQMAMDAGLVDHENTFGQVMIAHGPYNAELTAFAQAVARECADVAGDTIEQGGGLGHNSAKAILARFGLEGE
jgi:hypothetical protein